MIPQKLELLAPAKNLETGIAAINHGADAVYIGTPKFGARKNSGNSISDIEKLIKYAHFFRSKIYITLNTILFDNELDEVQKLIYQIYNIGADALIIQDMAILEMNLPPIALHASTQTNNFDIKQIKFFDKIGLQRAILARELNLEEIKLIKNETKIELEYFVHGALCVSLSGQCYMSHAVGGRSANRGECAQACRLKYSLTDSSGNILLKEKHLLSLKDLNLSGKIKDLANAGITSFKIEGRLKDISYVKNVVASYRQKLDAILDGKSFVKASSGITKFNFVPDPENSFNRQSSDYFLNGKHSGLINFDTPKSQGKYLGKVIKVKEKEIEIETDILINNGDGLCFLDKSSELQGLRVNLVSGKFVNVGLNHGLSVGMKIYRNHDQLFEKQLDKSDKCRKISVNILLIEKENGFEISAIDEDNNSVQHLFEYQKQIASNPVKSIETIKMQLSKSGETDFNIEKVVIDFSNTFFFQSSQLNEFRRIILEKLKEFRNINYVSDKFKFEKTEITFYKETLDYKANISNKLSEQFYKRHKVKVIEKAVEISETNIKKDLMTMRYCLKYELGKCAKFQNFKDEKLQEPLHILNNNKSYLLEFDCKNCMMIVKTE